jgi:hypothetical protein
MNGRVYDPLVSRFLSPDPYIQAPDYSQSFNRYSYCINNPLKYTDPTGEFFGTVFTFFVDLYKTAFLDGGLDPTSRRARRSAWRDFDPSAEWSRTNKAWKIDKGLLEGDFKQVFSRFTWELPHTIAGNYHGHLQNNLGNVDMVDYFDGATFLMNENADSRDGISIGNYIYIRERDEINYTNFREYVLNTGLYLHEYGHYLQLQSWGSWARITGDLLSLGSASSLDWRSTPFHRDIWIERDANARVWAKYGDEMGTDAHRMFTAGRFRDRRYYDGRFLRNFLTFGHSWLLFYFYDVTYSN